MIQDFFSWFASAQKSLTKRPWLIVGKGPSFADFGVIAPDSYSTFGLNHVVQKVKVTVAHAIDIDVITACQDVLEDNAEYLVMPWHPHVEYRAGRKTLQDWAQEIPVLQRMADSGRLLWYNASTAHKSHGDSPTVHVAFFSAEAALNLLAMAGVKKIRSIGIDGGASYSQAFSATGTLLANGRKSFNKQFGQMAKTIFKYQLDFCPMNGQWPIKVFVATTEAQMLATKVLEYSIKKHASGNVEVVPMHLCSVEIPKPKHEKNWPRTPFSFQRFIIPEVCQYKGRAIYLDSDMQVFTDIRALWEMDFQENALLSAADAKEGGRKPQYSVMLLDCEELTWNIKEIVQRLDDGSLTYESLMHKMSVAPTQSAAIPAFWNSLEAYKEDETALLHYTEMTTQPWIYASHPLGYLWCRDFIEAIRSGFIEESMLDEHIEKGWVRPSLRYQLEHNLEDPLLLPRNILQEDKRFLAPFHALHNHGSKPWSSLPGLMLGISRRVYFLSPLPRLQRLWRAWRTRFD